MELNFNKNLLVKHWNYKDSCEKCNEAEALFKEYEIPYAILISDKAIFGDVMKKTKSMSIPQIIINGEYIGGLDEFKQYLEER